MNARSVCQACAPVIGLLLAHTVLAGTTYYVKNGGNDNLNGTSDGEAWATIDRVHQEFEAINPIGPGDSVLFKCGDKWDEQLVISSSGSESGGAIDWITIGAYGSGDRPIIGYDEVLSGWTATGGGYDNVYQISTSGFDEPEVHLVNETTTSGGATGYFRVYSRKSSIQAVEDQAGSSYWASNILYVHAFDDTDLTTTLNKTLYGNTTGWLVRQIGEETEDDMYLYGAIRTNDESYIKMQNIHAVCSAYGIGGKVTHHILVDDCRLSGNVNATLFGHNEETTASHDITTQNCEIRFNGNGLRHHRSNALVAHDNTISDHWTRVSGEDQTMMGFQNSYDVQVYDNDISDGRFGFATFTDSGTTRVDFIIHHNYYHGVIDRAVWFTRAGSGKFGGNLHIYHNLFWLDSGPGAVPQAFRIDAATASTTEPYKLYNNTIRGTYGLWMRDANPINLVLQNNIFYNCTRHIYDVAETVDTSVHVRNYNCLNTIGTGHTIFWAGVEYDDWGEYRDIGNPGRNLELSGKHGDPGLVDAPDDVSPGDGGNCDDTGVDPPGDVPFDPDTAKDFYGENIGGSGSVSIGCAEVRQVE